MVRGAVLKTVGPKGFAGSSPVSGANGCGGIGRHARFRFWSLGTEGSNPFTRTNINAGGNRHEERERELAYLPRTRYS